MTTDDSARQHAIAAQRGNRAPRRRSVVCEYYRAGREKMLSVGREERLAGDGKQPRATRCGKKF